VILINFILASSKKKMSPSPKYRRVNKKTLIALNSDATSIETIPNQNNCVLYFRENNCILDIDVNENKSI